MLNLNITSYLDDRLVFRCFGSLSKNMYRRNFQEFRGISPKSAFQEPKIKILRQILPKFHFSFPQDLHPFNENFTAILIRSAVFGVCRSYFCIRVPHFTHTYTHAPTQLQYAVSGITRAKRPTKTEPEPNKFRTIERRGVTGLSISTHQLINASTHQHTNTIITTSTHKTHQRINTSNQTHKHINTPTHQHTNTIVSTSTHQRSVLMPACVSSASASVYPFCSVYVCSFREAFVRR